MKYNYSGYYKGKVRESADANENNTTGTKFQENHLNGDYDTFLVEYSGDIENELKDIDYADVYLTGKFFALLYVKKGMINNLLERVPQIISVEQNYPYTLSGLTTSQAENFQIINTNNIQLNGEGVIVGIIGTGIDYLNPRFSTPTGKSRIVAIWDQTAEIGPKPQYLSYGTEYTNANLNSAISAYTLGRDPYEIVDHRDETGHGTAIAGIIGGRTLSNNDFFRSLAGQCEFAIVKLIEARESTLEYAGIPKDTKNVYQASNITTAIRYLSDLQIKLKKPMVVYLPLGTNFGARDGSSFLERYIDNLSQRSNFSVVTNTGSQGLGETHTSDIIDYSNAPKNIFVNVDPNQKVVSMAIYTSRLNNIFMSVLSPNGNQINMIPISSSEVQERYITIEENNISLQYFIHETPNGAVSINLRINNAVGGVWKITLNGDILVAGRFDAWLPQKQLLMEETRFLNPDPEITLLTPCTAVNIIVTSYYNEIENTAVLISGRGFSRSGIIEPSVTCDGINILTVGINNSLTVASGAAMGGAILAGTAALVYQWGIVQRNYLDLAPPKLKSLLIASTVREEGVIYPNQQWGYGKLSLSKLQENIEKFSQRNNKEDNYRHLYISIPKEVSQYLK
ncbi:S8 family serine peptidase [Clostridium sp.]|uniref:S8 family serine peptidase n=1 Tax=Clostridium sp. TaxID=1506 RepID=UPI002FCB62C4